MAVSASTVAEEPTLRRSPAPDRGHRTPWWLWVCVAAIVVFCLLPFYWLVNISLKTGPDLSSADIIPPHPSFANYTSIFQNDDFTRALLNSAIVSLVTTAIRRDDRRVRGLTPWRG